MRLLEHPLYQREIESVTIRLLSWENCKKELSYFREQLVWLGIFDRCAAILRCKYGQNCAVHVLGLSGEKVRACFAEYWDSPQFFFLPCDLKAGIPEIKEHIYCIWQVQHIQGQCHRINRYNHVKCVRFASYAGMCPSERDKTDSCEIYGASDGGTSFFTEQSFGHIDCNTLRVWLSTK